VDWCEAQELSACRAEDWAPEESCLADIAAIPCGDALELPCSCGTGRETCP
jgi:hypothetical protein